MFNTTSCQFIHKDEEEKIYSQRTKKRKENIIMDSLVREILEKKFEKIAQQTQKKKKSIEFNSMDTVRIYLDCAVPKKLARKTHHDIESSLQNAKSQSPVTSHPLSNKSSWFEIDHSQRILTHLIKWPFLFKRSSIIFCLSSSSTRNVLRLSYLNNCFYQN